MKPELPKSKLKPALEIIVGMIAIWTFVIQTKTWYDNRSPHFQLTCTTRSVSDYIESMPDGTRETNKVAQCLIRISSSSEQNGNLAVESLYAQLKIRKQWEDCMIMTADPETSVSYTAGRDKLLQAGFLQNTHFKPFEPVVISRDTPYTRIVTIKRPPWSSLEDIDGLRFSVRDIFSREYILECELPNDSNKAHPNFPN